MATCVDVADAEYPATFKGEQIIPAEGKSLRPAFNNKVFKHNPIGWEHHGNRGFRDGKWKLVAKSKEWELYDIESDRSELRNLASVYPKITWEMIEKYKNWAAHVGVVEW